jgi:DNA-binding transcriptional ArsR family regulator
MPVLLSFTLDTRDVADQLKALADKAELAIARALNRTADGVLGVAVRRISEDLKITQATARKALKVVKANQTLLQAEVVGTGHRISLTEFGARQTATGVAYNIGRGTKVVEHGFITTVRSARQAAMGVSSTGVFTRKKDLVRKSPGAWSKNLPIQQKYGPSIPHVFAASQIMDAIKARAEVDLQKNLEHEVEFLLSQQR